MRPTRARAAQEPDALAHPLSATSGPALVPWSVVNPDELLRADAGIGQLGGERDVLLAEDEEGAPAGPLIAAAASRDGSG